MNTRPPPPHPDPHACDRVAVLPGSVVLPFFSKLRIQTPLSDFNFVTKKELLLHFLNLKVIIIAEPLVVSDMDGHLKKVSCDDAHMKESLETITSAID